MIYTYEATTASVCFMRFKNYRFIILQQIYEVSIITMSNCHLVTMTVYKDILNLSNKVMPNTLRTLQIGIIIHYE